MSEWNFYIHFFYLHGWLLIVQQTNKMNKKQTLDCSRGQVGTSWKPLDDREKCVFTDRFLPDRQQSAAVTCGCMEDIDLSKNIFVLLFKVKFTQLEMCCLRCKAQLLL